MHRYDLFEYVNDGYIPFREPLLRYATLVLPSSQAGYEELTTHYPAFAAKVRVARMGGGEAGQSLPSSDDVFRIATCSFVSPVKRLDLLVAALALTNYRIDWCHIGDGPGLDEIRARAATLPLNVSSTFIGRLPATAVGPFYGGREIDLFVNVSSSEGVPVSIQEALSASIPVLATNVGGTGEIIDDSVGRLVEADISPEQLAAELADFQKLPAGARASKRVAARQRWEERCDAERLAAEFAEVVVGRMDRSL